MPNYRKPIWWSSFTQSLFQNASTLQQANKYLSAYHSAAFRAINPEMLNSIKIQYQLLEKFNSPMVSAAMKVQNFYQAQTYWKDVLENINWDDVKENGIDYEESSEILDDLFSDTIPEQTNEQDIPDTSEPKKEIDVITAVAFIANIIKICEFLGKLISQINTQEIQDKVVALYLFLKDIAEDFLDQFPD